MLHLALTLLLAQDPQAVPQAAPQVASAASLTAPESPEPQAPARGVSALEGRPAAAKTRIDKAKPWMRVWYWPPTPGHAATDAPSSAPYSGVGEYSGGPIDPVRFPTNRVRVLDEEHEIQGVATWLKAHPTAQVQVDGYADARGSKAKNQSLSLSRAEAVKAKFVAEGIEASRISVNGHGAAEALPGETADEGWWRSRRVTIQVNP